MKKIINTLFFIFVFFLMSFSSFAINQTDELLKKDISLEKNLFIEEPLKIDLTDFYNELKKKYNTNILFEYNVTGEQTVSSPVFEKKFKTFWTKEINLNIYKLENNKKELIINKKINIFVYKAKIDTLYDKLVEKDFNDFKLKAEELGILVNAIWITNNKVAKFKFKEKFIWDLNLKNYLLIFWEKEFILNILSKINRENIGKKINIVWISSFNIDILKNYLWNFLANKKWISKIVLLDKAAQFEVFKSTDDIDNLVKILKKDKYNFVELDWTNKISNFLFLSKFVNNLSNLWFQVQNIYILLVIPFLFLFVVIFKHLIWLTPAWITIPVLLTILFFKLGLYVILFFIIFVLFNILLSKFISKYSLHYAPKVVLLEIINILFLIILFNVFIDKNIFYIQINDIMLFIIFIIVSERLINIIVSKEFGEYKISIFNTIIFSTFSYIFLSLSFVKTIILTYPELILFIIPIVFMIWKFTWLRITEYFRFKEIIKSIEE